MTLTSGRVAVRIVHPVGLCPSDPIAAQVAADQSPISAMSHIETPTTMEIEALRLPQIRTHHVDQLLIKLQMSARVGLPRRINGMHADVVFNNLDHQTIEGAAGACNELHNVSTADFLLVRGLIGEQHRRIAQN